MIAAHARFVEAIDADRLEVPERAVLVQAAVARIDRQPRLAEDVGEEPGRGIAIVGVQQIEEVTADELVDAVAEDARHRAAGVDDQAIGCNQVDAVGAVLDEEAEALLTLAEQLFGALALGDVAGDALDAGRDCRRGGSGGR